MLETARQVVQSKVEAADTHPPSNWTSSAVRRPADGILDRSALENPTMTELLERAQFESIIRELVKPLNKQYPRPWMTKLKDPRQADVFVVGKNQEKGLPDGRRVLRAPRRRSIQ